ncbi:MAG: quinone oxidoreductase family protein [Acidimicrobiales bacterium]
MRAVGVEEFGGPEALRIVELATPPCGADEIRIRVRAAAVNPTDTYTVNGARAELLAQQGPPPYVPGMDAAGVVDEIGAEVDTELSVGDAVMAMVIPRGSSGAYASEVVVPAGIVVPIPDGASMAEAATLPMNGLTADLALDLLDLGPGDTLAVTGAAGAFGGYIVQLAKVAGLTVIADASEADEALVRGLGADHVVRRGPDVAERIREIVPDGVDGLADGSVQGLEIIDAVRDGGRVATVRGDAGPDEPIRDITWHPVWVRVHEKAGDKLDRLRALASEGKVSLRVAQTFPADQAAEAHRVLHRGGTRGRCVIEWRD